MPPKKSYESYDSESDGDSQSQRKRGTKKQKLDKNSDEYKKRRERNNIAVKKSREASRQKAKETLDKVSRLRDENKALEQKVTILNKELGVLRDLFLSHATMTGTPQASVTSLLPKEEKVDNDNSEDSSATSEAVAKDHLYVVTQGNS